MNSSQDTQVKFEVDGRTVFARLNPEDQAALDELLAKGSIVTVQQSDSDTEGHIRARATEDNELWVDVEGHAMTLRLPNAGDAEALRRMLAVGALTATVAVGGFAAGTYVAQMPAPAQPITIPAAHAPASAPMTINSDEGLADKASQAAAADFASSRAGTSEVSLPVSGAPTKATTGDSSDQDINVSTRPHQPVAAPAPAPEPAPGNRSGGSHPE